MDDNNYQTAKEPTSTKVMNFIQTIWPKVYGIINDLFFGTIHFIFDTLSGLWRR